MSLPPEKDPQVTLVIWASFVMSQLVFFAIAHQLPAGESGVPSLVWPVLALGAAAGSVYIPMWMQAPGQTVFIVRWALAEVAALAGMLAWWLSGSLGVQLLCAGIGMAAHIAAFPGLPRPR